MGGGRLSLHHPKRVPGRGGASGSRPGAALPVKNGLPGPCYAEGGETGLRRASSAESSAGFPPAETALAGAADCGFQSPDGAIMGWEVFPLAIRRILNGNHAVLRSHARPVQKINETITALLDDMAETMYESNLSLIHI